MTTTSAWPERPWGAGHRAERGAAGDTWARRTWLGRAEDWLDERGKGAWIAAIVLGFVFVWPVGLALLAYAIWSKRMFTRHACADRADRLHRHARRFGGAAFRTSGNSAFDAYKADTLERLQREQEEFESFLTRLRESKDKAEFDQYMDERLRAARAPDSDAPGDDTPDMQGPGRY